MDDFKLHQPSRRRALLHLSILLNLVLLGGLALRSYRPDLEFAPLLVNSSLRNPAEQPEALPVPEHAKLFAPLHGSGHPVAHPHSLPLSVSSSVLDKVVEQSGSNLALKPARDCKACSPEDEFCQQLGFVASATSSHGLFRFLPGVLLEDTSSLIWLYCLVCPSATSLVRIISHVRSSTKERIFVSVGSLPSCVEGKLSLLLPLVDL